MSDENRIGMDPKWNPWPDAVEGFRDEFSRVRPPEVTTLRDVADYLHEEVEPQLTLAHDLLEEGVCQEYARGVVFDVARACACLAAFIKTGTLPQIEDHTSGNARVLAGVLRRASEAGGYLSGNLTTLARTVEHAVKQIDGAT